MRDVRRFALMAALALAFAALPTALPASAAHMTDTTELTATDNVGAAVAFSKAAFPDGAEEVGLGRDDTFPDSLASGLMQASRPLLLTKSDALSEETKTELARLQAKKVFILGGTAAVSDAVKAELEGLNYTVTRLSGAGRVETAVEVAKAMGASAEAAIIARAAGDDEDPSRGFADSLAAGGWAAKDAMPVLLTNTESLSTATSDYIKSSSIKTVYVVGGRAAVSDATETQLTALGLTVERVSGPTRFHTAVAIAVKRGFATAKDAGKVILTEGQAPDAWAAGFASAALSKKNNAPIVLSVGDEVPEPTTQYLTSDGTPAAALTCSPSAASAACDAAATALGQTETEGGGPITFTSTSVGRYDHAVGRLLEPRTVNALKASGCGYTNEPVFFEPKTGVLYLMLADAQGTCSVDFAITTSAGVQHVSTEFSIGENFTPPSLMQIPELAVVRPVKQTEEGVVLRFVFDEEIAPGTAIDGNKFHIFSYKGTPSNSVPESRPTSFQRDPRNPNAVLAVFRSAQYEESTVAVVEGGLVCSGGPTLDSFAGQCNASGVTAGQIFPGAVRDIDNFPNPVAHYPLRTFDRTASASDRPDLLSVGEFDSASQSLLFTFSEPVSAPSASQIGDASLLLKDGTIKRSDANTFTVGPTTDALRVSFTGDGLSTAEAEQLRRAFVKQDVVTEAAPSALKNTPIAVVIAGGGISDLPDFVNVENVETGAVQKVTYVFEEPLDDFDTTLGVNSKFVAVKSDGTVAYPPMNTSCTNASMCTANIPTISTDKKKVTVVFTPATGTYCTTTAPSDPKCKSVGLDNTLLYHTVLTGAVRAFSSQLRNFADTIRVPAPEIYPPGQTKAPDLTQVKARFVAANCQLGNVGGTSTNGSFELSYTFDANIADVTPVIGFFQVWYNHDDKPRVTEYPVDSTNKINSFMISASSGAKAAWNAKYDCNTQDSGSPSGSSWTPQLPTVGAGAALSDSAGNKTDVVYMSVTLGRVKRSGGTEINYGAGLKVPN